MLRGDLFNKSLASMRGLPSFLPLTNQWLGRRQTGGLRAIILANLTPDVRYTRRMPRTSRSEIEDALALQAAVAIIGPRQVCNSTLALE